MTEEKKIEVKDKFCKTKIVATLGPACDDEETLKKMILAGVDGARFNFAYGSYEDHKARIDRFRKVEAELNLDLPCILDTSGPEIRIGKFPSPVELKQGQTFTFTIDNVPGDINQCTISQNIIKDVEPGTRILVDDGKIETLVLEVASTSLKCTVLTGGIIDSNKGVNIPGIITTMPYLTEKDANDIKFAVENNFDYIALSFVRNKHDIQTIRDYLKKLNNDSIKIISKIENQQALENLEEILKLSDGSMVARGDLGVEIPIEHLPIAQKKIIRHSIKNGKIVITAAQMLDSMINNPRPTRAEVTDIANAIIDGTSALMLSAETAMGNHPVESVFYMKKVAKETEKNLGYKLAYSLKDFQNKNVEDENIYREVITYSVAVTANLLKAAAIICVTTEGKKPTILSRYRGMVPIFAISKSKNVARICSLIWNVKPVFVKDSKNIQDLIQKGIQKLKELGYLKVGDSVVLSGRAEKDSGEKFANVVGGVMKIV